MRNLWRVLKSRKWRFSAGNNVVLDFHYIKPGSSVKTGARGVDYFVGEQELVEYARENRLLDLPGPTQSSETKRKPRVGQDNEAETKRKRSKVEDYRDDSQNSSNSKKNMAHVRSHSPEKPQVGLSSCYIHTKYPQQNCFCRLLRIP